MCRIGTHVAPPPVSKAHARRADVNGAARTPWRAGSVPTLNAGLAPDPVARNGCGDCRSCSRSLSLADSLRN